jgi:tetratricopeptide (TPR) repeat protein
LKKLAENGEDPYALRELAIQAGLLQRYEDAISLWERFTRQKPDIPEAYINMGTAHFQLGDYQHALENARKAVELAPHFRESQYNHAIVLIHLGRVKEALPILKCLCQDHDRYLPGLFLLVSGYLCAEDLNSAHKTLRHLKATPLGPVLSVSFETFVNGLIKAEQFGYALRVAKGAFDCQCGNDALRRAITELEGEEVVEMVASGR